MFMGGGGGVGGVGGTVFLDMVDTIIVCPMSRSIQRGKSRFSPSVFLKFSSSLPLVPPSA